MKKRYGSRQDSQGASPGPCGGIWDKADAFVRANHTKTLADPTNTRVLEAVVSRDARLQWRRRRTHHARCSSSRGTLRAGSARRRGERRKKGGCEKRIERGGVSQATRHPWAPRVRKAQAGSRRSAWCRSARFAIIRRKACAILSSCPWRSSWEAGLGPSGEEKPPSSGSMRPRSASCIRASVAGPGAEKGVLPPPSEYSGVDGCDRAGRCGTAAVPNPLAEMTVEQETVAAWFRCHRVGRTLVLRVASSVAFFHMGISDLSE